MPIDKTKICCRGDSSRNEPCPPTVPNFFKPNYRYTERPLYRKFIVPNFHYTEESLGRNPIKPKIHYAENIILNLFLYNDDSVL